MDPVTTNRANVKVNYETEVVPIHIDLLRCLVGILILAGYFPKTIIGVCLLGISLLLQQPLRSHDSQSVLLMPELEYSAVAVEIVPFVKTYATSFAMSGMALVLLFSKSGKKFFPMLLARRRLRPQ